MHSSQFRKEIHLQAKVYFCISVILGLYSQFISSIWATFITLWFAHMGVKRQTDIHAHMMKLNKLTHRGNYFRKSGMHLKVVVGWVWAPALV